MFKILIGARFAKYYTLLVSSTNEKYFMFFNIKKMEPNKLKPLSWYFYY